MRPSLDPAGRLIQQTLGWAGFYSAAMQRKLLTPVEEGRRNQTDSTAVLTRPLNRGSLRLLEAVERDRTWELVELGRARQRLFDQSRLSRRRLRMLIGLMGLAALALLFLCSR